MARKLIRFSGESSLVYDGEEKERLRQEKKDLELEHMLYWGEDFPEYEPIDWDK